jgi:disulfide bond formation protein DsbB
MENNNFKIGTAAFLITVASVTEIEGYVKYFLLTVAVISLIMGIYHYHKAFKPQQLSK